MIEFKVPNILISIKPEWVKKILSGEKTIEVRKTKPKFAPPFTCYIYECGTGKIVAEFVCDKIFKYTTTGVKCGEEISDEEMEKGSCLTHEHLQKYETNGLSCGQSFWVVGLFGWHISNLKIYDTPIDLKEHGIKRPPQSWQYIYMVQRGEVKWLKYLH